jgi:single-strand DNA-binding protein
VSNDNAVTIIGTMTRDPEIRYTPNGKTVATFGIARNPRRREGNEWVDGDPQFYDVKAWGTLAENISESLQKGNRVVVFGELEHRTWETDSGDKRSKVEIKAESVGPDLRWASATVTRNERSDGGGQRRQQQPAEVDNPY